MKKQFIGAMALLMTFGLSSCGTTEAKSDEAACKTVLTGLTDFKASNELTPQMMTDPAKALALLKPIGKILDKAADQAKTEALEESLEKVSDVLEDGGSASLADLAGIQTQVQNIDTICKAEGVNLKDALK